jgi:hypothetical protein
VDHPHVLIEMHIDLRTWTNVGTSLLETIGNGLTKILKYK